MLYKKSREAALTAQLFENPGSEYRAAPFWAWNCKLDRNQLLSQISDLKEMGMGGFHIHCRVGLDTEYLGEEFFDDVRACGEMAKEKDMLCWLYDEDRWPSGSAGGMVTKDERLRARFLVFSPEKDMEENEETAVMAAAKAVRSKNRRLLARFGIELDEKGYLKTYKSLLEGETAENVWEAWLEISGTTPWFNNQAYVNTLDKKAVDRFIEITHEKYYAELEAEFGSGIPAIFTDEPQTSHKEILEGPFERKPMILPYTDDVEESFREQYGISLLEHLPELIWELPDGQVSQIRYYYHAHICKRFSEAFGDNIGTWCEQHGISLTGHMMSEWTLYSQTMTVGEVMRPMKQFGLPGVDMLCDAREYSTVKQAQSVAHQCGREGVMSEIYGVTGWGFDFRNHKLAGDWQAALGVTVRVPHLTWVSMEGEAKRDYPASIGYQSPWYKEYPYIENHFARLGTALTRGIPKVKIGIIHPVESYWLYWGNRKQTSVIRQALETNFLNLIDWMLFGLLDFDFISEAMLSEEEEAGSGEKEFVMGKMHYEVIVVPECHTLRRSTLDRLTAFQEKGGIIIFIGEAPKYIDALPSGEGALLAGKCRNIPYSCAFLLEELEPFRELDITVRNIDGEDPTRVKHFETGIRSHNLFYQMREDGKNRWLFICHVNKPVNEHITYMEEWNVELQGIYKPICHDTMTGDIYPLNAVYKNGKTNITYETSQHGSLLLLLEPGMQDKAIPKAQYSFPKKKQYLPQPESYQLEEPNVLLLDMAEYAFDDEEWQKTEEILCIDNLFRERLGYPLRLEALAQPWTQQDNMEAKHKLRLKFRIDSEIDSGIYPAAELAMEHPEEAKLFWNGVEIEPKVTGWFVDKCLKKVAIPRICKGENILESVIPFQQKTNVEWCYLLGDFGVLAAGTKTKIIPKPETIYYGNYVNQGLPFYAGNLVYDVVMTCNAGYLHLETSHYKGALVQIELDGKTKGNIVLAPYELNLGKVNAGEHRLRIRIFGNRVNAFGALHHADASEKWYGPNLWRTEGNKWSYEYQFEEMGILTTPQYWITEDETDRRS